MSDQTAYEPVSGEFLAAMIRLGAALGQIHPDDADALLAPSIGDSAVEEGQ